MKTIREQAKDFVNGLDYDTVNEWTIAQHSSMTHMWVQVYPDGQVSETEEADNNTTHWIDYPDKQVASIYEISRATAEPCGCDICTMYRHFEEEDKEDFIAMYGEEDWEYCNETPYEEALRDCDMLKRNSDILHEMLDAIDNIDYGYFDDEND